MSDAPIQTMSVPQAQGRLDGLAADKTWGQKLLANDPATLSEFKSLAARIANVDAADDQALLALDKAPNTGNSYGSELLPADKFAWIDGYRSAGFSEAETAEALDGGRTYTPEQVAWARSLLNELMSDPEWSRGLMNHGATQYLEMKRLSVILATAA